MTTKLQMARIAIQFLEDRDGESEASKTIREALRQADEGPAPKPACAWCEELGTVLWWRFPITEPPIRWIAARHGVS